MKVVYICSRYAGDIETNVAWAIKYSQFVYRKGYLPICVHTFLDKVTGLSEAEHREELLKVGLDFVKICDELWIFEKDGISSGMKNEIKLAQELKMKIKWYINQNCKEVKNEF